MGEKTFFGGYDDEEAAERDADVQPELDDLERDGEAPGLDPWLPPPSEE